MKFNFDFRQGLLADIINHHPEAFALHAANHPIEVRASEKAWKVDPLNISGLDVLAASFSPPCQHFSKGEKALLSPSVVRFNTGATGHDMREPLATVTANSFKKRPGGAAPLGMLAPVLTYGQQGGRNRSAEVPLHTVTASAKDQNAVIVPTLVGCGGRAGQSRPRGADEPAATITAKADVCVAATFLAQHNNDDRRAGGVNPGRPATEPLSTITANPQQGVISAFVARQFGASTGHSMEEPAHTATAGVNKSMLVAPLFQKYYGTGDGARIDEPTHTVTVKDRFAYIEAELALPPFTEEMADRAREVAAFLRAHGEWDDREFVTFDIDGVNVVMVDIGMRMLTPRELFNAQGFPPDYIIDLEYKGKPLPKSDQISCCGNSVSPPMAAALIAANCSHLSRYEVAA